MESNKSPATDGLPSEFYQMFCSEVPKPLLEALNYGFEIGQLSISQKRRIVKLIPKKSEELYYIKRGPLTLLNCNCKLPKDPSPQTDFLKRLFIGENICLIDSVVNYTTTKKTPGLQLFLDFGKAFDTLE